MTNILRSLNLKDSPSDESGSGNILRRSGIISEPELNKMPFELTPEDVEGIPLDTGEGVPQTSLGAGDYLEGSLDALATTATGATFGMLGGASAAVMQLMEEMITGQYGTPEAADRVKEQFDLTSQYYTWQPRTEGGQAIVSAVGDVAGQIPMAPQLMAFTPQMQATKQALAAKATQFRPILNAKLGRNANLIDENNLPSKPLQKALVKNGVDYSLILDDPEGIPNLPAGTDPNNLVKKVIIKRIKSGSDNKALHNKMLDNGQVVTDKLGEQAVKQGFRPGDVSSAKNANVQTRSIMSDMLEQKRKIEGSSEQALVRRPSDFIGDEVMNRVDIIRNKSLELRKDLDGISKNLKGVDIDTDSIQTKVFEGLERAGIHIPDEAYQNPILLKNLLRDKKFFEGSDISKDNMSQKVIRDVVDLLSEDKEPDALRAHKLKRQIDTMIDYKQKTYGGLTDTGKNFAKSVRRSLNDSIREISPEYARTNDQLTQIFTALDEVRNVIPKKIDLDSDVASAAMGQEMRKLLSNYSKRNEIRRSLQVIDDTASEYAGDFDVSIDRLVQFNNTLDTRFRPTARGSFKAEIGDAIGQEISAVGMAKQKALNVTVESIEKLRKINDEEAFNTMQRLLKRK